MPELMSILVASREKQHENHKFFAALKGIDLDKESSNSSNRDPWEDMKARVFSRGQTENSDDILSLQGFNASKAGFGIGMGLEYADNKNFEPENPFG